MHSRTMEDILKNTEGYNVQFFFAHGLPIPDCFNKLTNDALKAGAKWLWFVEDDMKLPNGTLDALVATHADVATADYPVTQDTKAVYKRGDTVYTCGTGCLYVRAEVFERVGQEWRVDMSYTLPNWEPQRIKNLEGRYGHHDVDFAQRVKRNRIPIAVIDIDVRQYRVDKRGEMGTNQGFDTVSVL